MEDFALGDAAELTCATSGVTPGFVDDEVRKVDRFIRIASAVGGALALGIVGTFWVYDGPRGARALAIFGAIALVVAVLSLAFGRRFWEPVGIVLAVVLFPASSLMKLLLREGRGNPGDRR